MVAPDTLSVRAWPSRDPRPTGEDVGRRRLIRPFAKRNGAVSGGCRSNGTSDAQSSSLAHRSSGHSKSEIPNGLGSEFVFGAPRKFTSALRCNLIAGPSRAEVAAVVCAIAVIRNKNLGAGLCPFPCISACVARNLQMAGALFSAMEAEHG